MKPRNTDTLSPKSLSLFSLSLQPFSMPQEQETLGFLAARSIKGKKSKEALAPFPLQPPAIFFSPSLAATQASSSGFEISCEEVSISPSQIWS